MPRKRSRGAAAGVQPAHRCKPGLADGARERVLRAGQCVQAEESVCPGARRFHRCDRSEPCAQRRVRRSRHHLTILGRFADAIPDFTRVIEAYPQLAYAHYNRGICYELLGLDDLAIEDISRSIELEPRAEFRFERRATIYFRKNLLDEALADYEEALVINPEYASALYGRGIIRLKKGNPTGREDIAAATRHRPNIAIEMGRAGVK